MHGFGLVFFQEKVVFSRWLIYVCTLFFLVTSVFRVVLGLV